jgi:aerobic-type carbon monoxide dehydrogenase small subunit (CoxS/CutS family)
MTAATIALTVNGRSVEVEAEGAKPLLAVLREDLALRGSRFGCGAEQCGACMVLVDGVPVTSCTRELGSVAGRSVTTVESPALDRLRQAFLDEQAGQCGYCLSGILISAAALLNEKASPSKQQIVEALDRHLCRCGVHNRIIRAIQRAAAEPGR